MHNKRVINLLRQIKYDERLPGVPCGMPDFRQLRRRKEEKGGRCKVRDRKKKMQKNANVKRRNKMVSISYRNVMQKSNQKKKKKRVP
jgi:hypothetical protein